MHHTEFFTEWLAYNGLKVRYKGLTYRIEVRRYKSSYPYQTDCISVYAVPVSKRSRHYRKVRAELGDDWSTCILDSDIEVQAEFSRLCRKVLEDRPAKQTLEGIYEDSPCN